MSSPLTFLDFQSLSSLATSASSVVQTGVKLPGWEKKTTPVEGGSEGVMMCGKAEVRSPRVVSSSLVRLHHRAHPQTAVETTSRGQLTRVPGPLGELDRTLGTGEGEEGKRSADRTSGKPEAHGGSEGEGQLLLTYRR